MNDNDQDVFDFVEQENIEHCDCQEHCTCGENCCCDDECRCCEECDCNHECEQTEDEIENELSNEEGDSSEDLAQTEENEVEEASNEESKVEECNIEEHRDYLRDLLRVQAEFDNYRKRMTTSLGEARHDGFMDAITQFLPALDSFKMATEYIQDKNTLMGIKFIEKGILDTLSKMGVEVIDASGKFNPEVHQAILAEDNPDYESGDIIKEAYKGFIYKGKVIRYSQVIVKK